MSEKGQKLTWIERPLAHGPTFHSTHYANFCAMRASGIPPLFGPGPGEFSRSPIF
jgi:hypothetical protein